MGVDGTARRIGPIADEVLVWVALQRRFPSLELRRLTPDEIRRIELCALAAREAAMFHDLYGLKVRTGRIDHIGGDPHATTPEVPEQRGASGGLPQAPEGGQGQPPGCR